MTKKLTISEASKVPGMPSVARIRQLDHVLHPERIGDRRVRIYKFDVVEAFARSRR